MDTKAAFEKWWEDEYSHLESSKYTDLVPHIKYGFFQAWKASRAAIEIEREPEHEWMGEYPSHDSFLDGYANGWNDCVDAITSHGIRIKGEKE